MSENNVIERILLIKKELNFDSDGAFADSININRSNFSQMMKGNRPIGENIINKICIQTNTNRDWLQSGTGSMFAANPSAANEANQSDEARYPHIKFVPLVGQYAYGGYLCGFGDQGYMEALPTVPVMVDHELRGKYMMFEVKGDSMNDASEDSILEGDRLLGREIRRDLWKYKLHIHKWDFIVVHRTEGILVKRITAHDTELGTITLHSLNPEYEDRTFHLNDVAQIFNVIEVHRSRRR